MDPKFAIKAVYTTNLLIDQCGLVFFIALIWVTVKYKKLHGNCHLLIGLYSACALLSKCVIFLPYTLFMTGQYLQLYVCAIVQFVPVAGMMNIWSLMLAIGMDRMLSVFWPVWYAKRNTKFSVITVFLLSNTFPLFICSLMVKNVSTHPNSKVQCMNADLMGNNSTTILYSAVTLNIATIFSYASIAVKFIWDRKHGKVSNAHVAIFKALSIIVAIQIGGWTLTFFVSLALANLQSILGADAMAILHYFTNCMSSLSSTVEVPALYFTSTEHRLALRKEFPRFFRLFPKGSAPEANKTTIATTTHHSNYNIANASRGHANIVRNHSFNQRF